MHLPGYLFEPHRRVFRLVGAGKRVGHLAIQESELKQGAVFVHGGRRYANQRVDM
jgi:hypothetical protein